MKSIAEIIDKCSSLASDIVQKNIEEVENFLK
jgi:hypothetical protein